MAVNWRCGFRALRKTPWPVGWTFQSRRTVFRTCPACPTINQMYPIATRIYCILNPMIMTWITNLRFFSSVSQQANTGFNLENNVVQRYVEKLVSQFVDAQQTLVNSTNSTSKAETSQLVYRLGPLVNAYKEYKLKTSEKRELDSIIRANEDKEMVEMARQDMVQVLSDVSHLEHEVLQHLVPKERADYSDVILELTAGVGGQEAMLFTEQMFNMYTKFAAMKGWMVNIVELDFSEQGGLRHTSAIVKGTEVYRCLKCEVGVHRVQRVPKTEKSGRMHTSTMTVSVLPQPSEIDVEIHKKDLKVDVFRASGSGGQHVNKTESAVRLSHLPTGIVAECQVSRSQIKNREMALEVLRSRIYERELEQQQKEFKMQKKFQIGTAARSEKIRTYNFSQDRITDHRLSGSRYNIDRFLLGGEALEDLIQDLQDDMHKEHLAQLLEQFEKQDTLRK